MKKTILTLSVVCTISLLTGCTEQEKNGLTDDEQVIYEIYNVDRRDIKRPGSQQGKSTIN